MPRLNKVTTPNVSEIGVNSEPVVFPSHWKDSEWIFPPTTAGSRRAVLYWVFPMSDGSMSNDAKWEPLIEQARRFVFSLRFENQRGKNHKNSGILGIFDKLRYFLVWMSKNDYECFSEVTPQAAIDYCNDLVSDKVDDADDEISAETFGSYIDIPVKIYEQASITGPRAITAMSAHPFGGRSAYSIASDLAQRCNRSIPPVPDEIYIGAMETTLNWLDVQALDAIDLVEAFVKLRVENAYKNPGRGKSSSYYENKLISSFTFRSAANSSKPWRKPIRHNASQTRWFVYKGVVSGERSCIQQLRTLILDVRDACTIVVQGTLGLRISEVCGLQAEPSDPKTGWPACIEVRPSRTGLNEIFYVKGRLFKERVGWQKTEWVAGLRPAGTDYIPPPIKALLRLHRLYAPWREMAGMSDLFFSLGAHSGLPSEIKNFRSITSDSLREGQKEFVREFVDLPTHLREWKLSTHQWRKSFALYMVRSDERLLPAVSEHFKHTSLAVTEQGYLGSDPDLNGVMDDVATWEAARLLHQALNQPEAIAGKMADIIAQNATTIRELGGEGGSDESKITRLAEALRDDDVRVWPAPWGKCFFRSETARCHHLAAGRFDGSAKRPHYAQRQASVCSECSNLLVIPEIHADFWQARLQANEQVHEANIAVGDLAAAAVARERARLATSILARMGIPAKNKT